MISPELPSDRTPLLRNDNDHSCNTGDEPPAVQILPLPSIDALEIELRSKNHNEFARSITESVQTMHIPSPVTGSSLTILICLREIQRRCSLEGFVETHVSDPAATGGISNSSVESPRALAMSEWSRFISWATTDDIQEFLWARFPVEGRPGNGVALVDIFFDETVPRLLSQSPSVSKALLSRWYSSPKKLRGGSTMSRLDAIAAPCLLHLLEVLTLFINHALLMSCILQPQITLSPSGVPQTDWRAITLLPLSLAFAVKRLTKRSLPFVLTFLVFTYTFPSSPQQNDSAYVLLLLILSIHLFKLHFPLSPSPVLLFPNSKPFMLSGILWATTFRIVVPAFLFFLPAFLLIAFLLSISLSDVFLLTLYPLYSSPAPINARVAFLAMLVVTLVLFGCLATSLLLLNPSMNSASSSNSDLIVWDLYTARASLQARQVFRDAISTYSAPYYFPVPLNLLSITFVGIPHTVLRLFRRDNGALDLNSKIKVILWRSIVLPFVYLISLTWSFSLFPQV